MDGSESGDKPTTAELLKKLNEAGFSVQFPSEQYIGGAWAIRVQMRTRVFVIDTESRRDAIAYLARKLGVQVE